MAPLHSTKSAHIGSTRHKPVRAEARPPFARSQTDRKLSAKRQFRTVTPAMAELSNDQFACVMQAFFGDNTL
jgi:hypothetical protein